MTSICICGATTICPRDCAGAIAQQLECEQRGHLTAGSIHEQAWAEPMADRPAGEFCYRCGATVSE